MKTADSPIVQQGLKEKPAPAHVNTTTTQEPEAPRPDTQESEQQPEPEPEPEQPQPEAKPKEESPERVLAKAVMRSMMPALLATIEAVLKCESLGAKRAYFLSDIPGFFTGDNMARFMVAQRVEAAGMKGVMGRITGKIRNEFARPHYEVLEGVTRPGTEASEQDLNDTGL